MLYFTFSVTNKFDILFKLHVSDITHYVMQPFKPHGRRIF